MIQQGKSIELCLVVQDAEMKKASLPLEELHTCRYIRVCKVVIQANAEEQRRRSDQSSLYQRTTNMRRKLEEQRPEQPYSRRDCEPELLQYVVADDKKARPQAGGEKEAGKAGGIMGEMRLGMAWMEPVLLPLAGMREARDRKPGRTRKLDWKDSF